MSNVIISPNMGMPIPVPGQDPGPDYASNIGSCLSITDGHTHAPGSGSQINPNGLNINADLPFNNNNITGLRSSRYIAQTSPLSLPTDLVCLYFSGVDLWANDGLGNQIQITSNGGVAGATGSISNLVSPASASYIAGTGSFIWKAGATTPANMDNAAITIRPFASGSPNGVTIQAPLGLAANYSLTLPTALAATSGAFVTSDNSGNLSYTNVDNSTLKITGGTVAVPTGGITTTQVANNTLTQVNMGSVGQQVSASCGFVNITSGSPSGNVFAADVVITTTGRPVMLIIQPDGISIASVNSLSGINFAFTRGGTPIGKIQIGNNQFVPSWVMLDTPSAGTYHYNLSYGYISGSSNSINNVVLMAYEL